MSHFLAVLALILGGLVWEHNVDREVYSDSLYTQAVSEFYARLGRALGGQRVAVIGAGFSGVTAADELRRCGWDDVVVLEARERIGGRVYTERQAAGQPTELGAFFVHRVSENPLAATIRKLGIRHREYDYFDVAYFFPNGTEAPKELWDGTYDYFLEVMEWFRKMKKTIKVDQPLSLTLQEWDPYDELSDDEAYVLNLLMFQFIVQDEQSELHDISSLAYPMGFNFAEEDTDWVLPNGYVEILESLAQGLKVELNSSVTSLRLDQTEDRSEIRVGVEGRDPLVVDSAVLSVPLGVLKHRQIQLQPPLPRGTLNSIADLGISNALKVTLCWQPEQVFWLNKTYFHKHDKEAGLKSYGRGNHLEFINAHRLNQCGCLIVSAETELAAKLGGLNPGETVGEREARVGDYLMGELAVMFGEGHPPPHRVRVSEWGTDRFSMGGYSHWRVDGGRTSQDTLSLPLWGGKLVLAGEHTTPDYYGSVHGAYISGIIAARKLIIERLTEELLGPRPTPSIVLGTVTLLFFVYRLIRS